MKNVKRIIFVAVILIGGSTLFRLWALDQYQSVFSSFDSLYSPTALVIHTSPALLPQTIGTSTIATSTVPTATTTSLSNNATATGTSVFSFSFPKKGSEIFIGCTYNVSWNVSINLHSINLSLVDGGTQKALGPVTSGLAGTKSNDPVIGLKWKVGNVWPGNYFILATNINDIESKKKSPQFTISPAPNTSPSFDMKTLCESSGGTL